MYKFSSNIILILCFGYSPIYANATELFSDDFSNNLSAWTPIGNWSIQQNELYVDYNITCGNIYCSQADMILNDQYQPNGNYIASIDFIRTIDAQHSTYYQAYTSFSLWQNTNSKIQIGIGGSGWNSWGGLQTMVNVDIQTWNGYWQQVFQQSFPYNWNPDEWNTAKIKKHGDTYSLYINDEYLMDYQDTFLNGTGKIGLHSYGTKRLDNFTLSSDTELTANAGPDQTVSENDIVILSGMNSTGTAPLTYSWSQIAGPTISLDLTDPLQPTFIAPYVNSNSTITFDLVVSSGTSSSNHDTVDITVVSVNNPPVPDAGDDSTIKEGANYILDGSNSYDPENDQISYAWQQIDGLPTVMLEPNNQMVNPSFTAPTGVVGQTLLFQLITSDGKESSIPTSDLSFSNADTVAITIVENSTPIAAAGPYETSDEGTQTTLDGSNSYDSDGGDTLSYQWTQTAGPTVQLNNATITTPSFTTPFTSAGGVDLEFTLTVTDDDPVNPKSSNDSVVVHVRNINDPPSCDLAYPSNDSLWPPNHKMKEIDIEGIMDDDSIYNTITLEITGVTQDEPVNGQGDGDSNPDAVIQEGESADSILLRAERAGNGNGRAYTIHFNANDGFESCSGMVTVGIPQNRKDTVIDDGQLYDSTSQ